MQVVLEIIIRVAEILTIIAGAAGVCLSLVLLFAPGLIQKVNRVLNRKMLTDNQLAAWNPSISSESFVLVHHRTFGGLLITGSTFILLILFILPPIPGSFGLFTDMALECATLLGKLAGLVGFGAGVCLLFFPAAFKVLGQKTDVCIDTRPAFDKLDTVCVDVDTFIIKYSWMFGLVGLIVSVALIIISVVNFQGTSATLGGRF